MKVIFLKQVIWRSALKLRVISQIVIAIVSATAAIHQLLKKQRNGSKALNLANVLSY